MSQFKSLDVTIPATSSTGDNFALARKALHTSFPTVLPCRSTEINSVYQFLIHHLTEKKPGSLYISGSPGTGKTAVVHHVLEEIVQALPQGRNSPFHQIFINCMNLSSPVLVFEHIAAELKLKKARGDDLKERIESRVTSKTGKMILVVLDEMDQLLNSRGNEFLSRIFEMTQLPQSKLVLIGVANSLDLITRHLPHLTTSASPTTSKVKQRNRSANMAKHCELLHFRPYEREQIVEILETRLSSVEVFDSVAIKLVANKVSSSTGDIRKALNACKSALDQMEKQKRVILKETADDGFNGSSPKKRRFNGAVDRIGIASMSKILGPGKDDGAMPIQQLLLLATLLRIRRRKSTSEESSPIPLSSVYEEYQRICETKGYELIDMSDMISIFAMLEDRSLVSLCRSPAGTPTGKKWKKSVGRTQDRLTFDSKAIEFLLQKGDLLNSIVNS